MRSRQRRRATDSPHRRQRLDQNEVTALSHYWTARHRIPGRTVWPWKVWPSPDIITTIAPPYSGTAAALAGSLLLMWTVWDRT